MSTHTAKKLAQDTDAGDVASKPLFIAHYRKSDEKRQSLATHLCNVAMLANTGCRPSWRTCDLPLGCCVSLAAPHVRHGGLCRKWGVAIGTNKKLIPIVWDQSPEELPGWMCQYQAVDLGGIGQQEAMDAIARIAETMKAEKQKGLFILGLLVAGLALFGK